MNKERSTKLTHLGRIKLKKREMAMIIGAYCYQCACGCSGPSCTEDNRDANAIKGITKTAGWGEGDNDACACASTPGTSDCSKGAYNLGH